MFTSTSMFQKFGTSQNLSFKDNESIWILHFYLSVLVCPTSPHPSQTKKKLQKMLNKHSHTNFTDRNLPPPRPGLGSKATIPPQLRHSAHHHLVCPWRCCQRPSTCQSCSACRREDGTLPARFLGCFGVAGWVGWLGWLVLLGGWLGGWLVGWLGGWLVGWFGRLVSWEVDSQKLSFWDACPPPNQKTPRKGCF